MEREEKEDLIFKKRCMEAAQLAFRRGIAVYTDFLGLAEQSLFCELKKELPPVACYAYGGIPEAERVCLCFDGTLGVLAEDGFRMPNEEQKLCFPIACLQISPTAKKFAEPLTHRDYLGALLHLGIDRSKIGDIYGKGTDAFVFCTDTIAEFLCRELNMVKHTPVMCGRTVPEEHALAPTLQEITGTVPSLRLDVLLGLAFRCARSAALDQISSGKVFINGRQTVKAGAAVKERDIVSVRGKGRFRLSQIGGPTRKDRTVVTIEKFIS